MLRFRENAAVPGVFAVAMCDCPPLSRDQITGAYPSHRTRPNSDRIVHVDLHWISPDWLGVFRGPPLRGRTFTRQNDDRARRAVGFSELAARRLSPGQAAIGRLFALTADDRKRNIPFVVGVIGNVLYDGMDSRPPADVYRNDYQPHFTSRLIMRLLSASVLTVIRFPARKVMRVMPSSVLRPQ